MRPDNSVLGSCGPRPVFFEQASTHSGLRCNTRRFHDAGGRLQQGTLRHRVGVDRLDSRRGDGLCPGTATSRRAQPAAVHAATFGRADRPDTALEGQALLDQVQHLRLGQRTVPLEHR